jgi:hypothetical protein
LWRWSLCWVAPSFGTIRRFVALTGSPPASRGRTANVEWSRHDIEPNPRRGFVGTFETAPPRERITSRG